MLNRRRQTHADAFQVINAYLSTSESESSDDEDIQEAEHIAAAVEESSDESSESIEDDESGDERQWKRKPFVPDYTENYACEPEPDDVKTPYMHFKSFVDDELLGKISEQSNTYFFQNKAPQNLTTTPKEIEMVIGILLKMGIVKMNNIKDYWSNFTYYEPIASVMSRNRFQVLLRYIHFVDNEDPQVDKTTKVWKIQPVLEHLRQNFLKLHPEQHQAIDEMSIAYKGKRGPRQYNAKKPKKWHFTVYCRAGSSGLVYDFELFSGRHPQPPSSAGVSGDVVIRLTNTLPENTTFKIFADNWFVSIPLIEALQNRGFQFTRTFRPNRIKISFQDEKLLKTAGRGSHDSLVHPGGKIVAVKWFDNRAVHLVSTYTGVEPISEIRRFNRKQREYVSIPCPAIIQEYNTFMGGIDLMDSLVALYKYVFKSCRWYMYIWHHMLHVALVNSWLLYRRHSRSEIPLKKFQLEVADNLIKVSVPVGRPRMSSILALLPQKRRRRSGESISNRETRFDEVGHFAVYCEKRSRCELCNSSSIFTHLKCCKCEVFLCLTKNKNCFLSYHQK